MSSEGQSRCACRGAPDGVDDITRRLGRKYPRLRNKLQLRQRSWTGGILSLSAGGEEYRNVTYLDEVDGLLPKATSAPSIAARTPKGPRFDFGGAVTGTIGMILLVFALVQGPEAGWTSPLIVGSSLGAVLLLALFVGIEARAVDPLMPLRLFRNRTLTTGLLIITRPSVRCCIF